MLKITILPIHTLADAQRELERLARLISGLSENTEPGTPGGPGLPGAPGATGPAGSMGPQGEPGNIVLPTPVMLGDIYYAGADGVTEVSRLGIPIDWDTIDYLLGIRDGIPSWRAVAAGVLLRGLYPAPYVFPLVNLYPEAP